MKVVVGAALAMGFVFMSSVALAGGNGSGNPKNNGSNIVITQEPIYIIKDGKLVSNPKR